MLESKSYWPNMETFVMCSRRARCFRTCPSQLSTQSLFTRSVMEISGIKVDLWRMWIEFTGLYHSAIEIYFLFEGWQMIQTPVVSQKDWDLWCDFGVPCLDYVSTLMFEYLIFHEHRAFVKNIRRFNFVWSSYSWVELVLWLLLFIQHFASFAIYLTQR